MAIVKVINSKASLKKAINYITKEEKTEKSLIEGVNCDRENPFESMQLIKEMYGKTGGRSYKHFVVSFPPNETVTTNQALEIAMHTLEQYREKHQILFAVHTDREHTHVHAIVNSVLLNGKKLQMSKKELEHIKQHCNNITRDMGFSVPEKGKNCYGEERDSLSVYSTEVYRFLKKAENQEVASYVERIATHVYIASKTAHNKNEFIEILSEQGISTTWEDTRKHITFTDRARELHGDAKCSIRNNRLEKYYNTSFSKEDLLNGFEINAQRTTATREATSQLNRSFYGTEQRIKKGIGENILRECNLAESGTREILRNSTITLAIKLQKRSHRQIDRTATSGIVTSGISLFELATHAIREKLQEEITNNEHRERI